MGKRKRNEVHPTDLTPNWNLPIHTLFVFGAPHERVNQGAPYSKFVFWEWAVKDWTNNTRHETGFLLPDQNNCRPPTVKPIPLGRVHLQGKAKRVEKYKRHFDALLAEKVEKFADPIDAGYYAITEDQVAQAMQAVAKSIRKRMINKDAAAMVTNYKSAFRAPRK
jgi:hypothetical protein